MEEAISQMKRMFTGKWIGEGFAKFPTIDDTAYTEELTMQADEYKDALFFSQKTLYKNNTPKNGHMVFWDTGFIIMKDNSIMLHSAQIGGRIEVYELVKQSENSFTFNSKVIMHDAKAYQSQRIFTVKGDHLHYEMNMATHGTDFQNHLEADLERAS